MKVDKIRAKADQISLFHVQLMCYHEESLAQAARNYAFTKDKKWETRYGTIKPEADNLLRFASLHSTKNKKFFIDMTYANTRCMSFEEKAIQLVNDGYPQQAISLLDSDEYVSIRKILQDGLQEYVTVNLKLFVNNSEISSGVTISVKEVSKLENRLAMMETEIKNTKLKVIEEFSARVAHDLRNPLSVIKNTFEILKQRDTDIQNGKYYNIIQDNIRRISFQIDDVMNFVKPRPLVVNNHSLHSIIKKALVSTNSKSNIEVIVDPHDVFLECDDCRIVTAFINILTNAIHAIQDERGFIQIKITDNPNKVIIDIQNSGPNIPKENLGRIFEPLFTTKQTGTGLGLVSVKNIVEQHGGTITVQNDPVTFTITLPKVQKNKITSQLNVDHNATERLTNVVIKY